MVNDYILSVQDVYNAVSEHMAALDKSWPDGSAAPAKVHIVEIIDGIKLRLIQTAEKNMNRYESPFDKAARKATGLDKKAPLPHTQPQEQVPGGAKTAMQLAHEAAQNRVRRSTS